MVGQRIPNPLILVQVQAIPPANSLPVKMLKLALSLYGGIGIHNGLRNRAVNSARGSSPLIGTACVLQW